MTYKIILKDAFKRFTLDQDKILLPEETVIRFKNKLKKVDLDILEYTVRIDKGRLDIPVYFSSCGRDAIEIIGTKKQMGKGATPHQAEASAVMELAERFSFFSFCKNPDNFFVEKYSNLKENLIPFDMIAQSVHDNSEDIDISRKIFEDLPLKWTKAFNLTRNQEILIPFNWFYMINEFNGPSAGNCVEEALSQGICEIIERHVSSIISQNHLKVPAIRANSVTDPLVKEMIEKYRKAGISIFISDFSLDIGIPSVGVLAYDPSTFPERSEIVWTAGTTPDPEKALSRALTEVAQLAGDFDTASKYVASGLPKLTRIEDAEFIINPGEKIDIQTLPELSNENIKIEVENCISALAKKGMEVIVVDTMHPLLDIPAFYTIIPGAHFRERSLGTSVGMFSAKIITENQTPHVAIKELKKIERLLPTKYYIKFYLGSCHLALNDPVTAIEYFTQSLELDPSEQDVPSIYSYMGVSFNEMGEYMKALDVLKKAVMYDNERTDIYNSMGFSHFKLKEHEQAIKCFKKVLRLNPGSAIDYANIASNYRDMGEKEKAIQYYEMSLAMDPSIEFARENLLKLGQN
ncbi:MAG: YcaO-like family protein [Desulfobacteraceae bacterium]|nr:YcaO-like family protein [Desulfobacteraceae bacterium]MDH3722265.1 YcaO-like family protein [Desulfobacteraceae bacterium]MDH3873299.1 YcaO-like family protein [Desulfobacteraceae bacterium]MDH3880088.1 YcaO-like family protein [Desulfobacteraceae bacterium]MDH3955438.1 YcaO-like family protein [Desulfobacteraceae bacterium]